MRVASSSYFFVSECIGSHCGLASKKNNCQGRSTELLPCIYLEAEPKKKKKKYITKIFGYPPHGGSKACFLLTLFQRFTRQPHFKA